MAATSQVAEHTTKGVETWEVVNDVTVWVWQYDRRTDKMIKNRVGGKAGGSKRLHISTDDRRFNQEQVVDEMKQHDPFTNGLLRFIGTNSPEDPEDIDRRYHLTHEDLVGMLSVRDEGIFRSEVEEIQSELVMRRLFEVAEREGTQVQLQIVRDVIEERYKVGGTQKTVREMIEAGELAGGTPLS